MHVRFPQRSTMFKCLVLLTLSFALAYDFSEDVVPKQNPDSELCDMGPIYWCKNLATANDCGALKYCVMNVWDIKRILQDSAIKNGKKVVTAAPANAVPKYVEDATQSSTPMSDIEGNTESVDSTFSPENDAKNATEENPQYSSSESDDKSGTGQNYPIHAPKNEKIRTDKGSHTKNPSEVKESQRESDALASNSEIGYPLKKNWCSVRATIRGPRQKVVSFSFFGNLTQSRLYFEGIKKNADVMPFFYPGWVMRVYHSIDEEDEYWPALQEFEIKYPYLDLCNINLLPLKEFHATAWRYSVIADRLVDIFVCRDLDTLFTKREVAAVSEWLNANISFHVMRDHPRHFQTISGGLWGAKRQVLPKLVQRLAKELWKVAHNHPSPPDLHLNLAFWDKLKGNVLQHDSYSCSSNFEANGHMRPWPVKRENSWCNFVGCNPQQNNPIISVACPEVCRPANHKDWQLC